MNINHLACINRRRKTRNLFDIFYSRPITTTTTTTELPPLFQAKSFPKSEQLTRSFNVDSSSSKNDIDEQSKPTAIPSSSSATTTLKPQSSTLLPLTVSSTIATPTTEDSLKPTTSEHDSNEDLHDDSSSSSSSSDEDFPLEVRLKQISEEVEKLSSKETNDHDIGRQSFFSLSDLIKTLQPNDKKTNPQIDSDYSNTMRVLGESLLNDEGRSLKSSDSSSSSLHVEEMDPTNL